MKLLILFIFLSLSFLAFGQDESRLYPTAEAKAFCEKYDSIVNAGRPLMRPGREDIFKNKVIEKLHNLIV